MTSGDSHLAVLPLLFWFQAGSCVRSVVCPESIFAQAMASGEPGRRPNNPVERDRLMMLKFVQDTPSQRVVFGAGSLARLAEEVARLGLSRVLVVATPGHGARLAALAADLLGSSCAGVHAQAVVHVPRAVAEAGIAEAARSRADGVVV